MKKTTPPPAPTPLAGTNQPVDWLFIFKFNAESFPGCTDAGKTPKLGSKGLFGGTVDEYKYGHSQQYVFASSLNPNVVKGSGCVGATRTDPLGATFAQVYEHPGYHYVVWNDQFYGNPMKTEFAPWGHSKGMVVWNDEGNGFVLQVSTPSWPASGSQAHPRPNDGNTLGCIRDDDIMVSQHFFALKLTQDDLKAVLQGLANSSVVTSLQYPEIVQNGGPAEIRALVNRLGKESKSTECLLTTLSSKVKLISKPSQLHLPPWQLVSAKLNGLPLRVASWWDNPKIYSAGAAAKISGWPSGLRKPGPVAIATTGNWKGKSIGLEGGLGKQYNQAKVEISTDAQTPSCIFGDLNQQGALRPNYAYPGQPMNDSQNGRGGTFYVLDHPELFKSLTDLLRGETAPASGPNGKSQTNSPTPI